MSEHEESETGTVSFFNAERGFGFIVPDHAGGDIFVGMAALDRAGLDTLRTGQRVRFRPVPDRNGNRPRAHDLELLEPLERADGASTDEGIEEPEFVGASLRPFIRGATLPPRGEAK